MDFLNKTLAQFTDLFRSMTPATRVTTFGLFAVIAVSLVFLFRFGVTRSDSYLFGGQVLEQDEIVRLEAAFSQAGLSNWEIVGNRVRVPSGQRHTFIAAAADANSLPKDFDMFLDELIQSSSPFEPGQLRDMKAKVTLERILAGYCEKMHGIQSANVTISEQRPSGFARQAKKTAVVAARAERNDNLTMEQVNTMRQTVAAGIGAPPENVTVMDLRGGVYPGTSNGESMVDGNLYLTTKRNYERQFQEKISQSLSYIPKVMVGVNVELNPRIEQTTQTQTYNQPQPIRSSMSNVKSTTRSESGGGRPGAVPNGVIANRAEEVAATSASGSESTNTETQEESESVVGREVVEYKEPGMTPTEVMAAIQIPKSYFLTVWHERNPVTDGSAPKTPDPAELSRLETEEITRIRESVQNLLPLLQLGKDPRPRVSVTSFEDVEQPELEEPGLVSQTGSFLLANWRTLGMGLLALVSLAFVRSMVRSGQNAATVPPSPAPASVAAKARDEANDDSNPEIPIEEDADSVLKRRFSATGPSLRDELAQLVREDPDAAAAIISNWIGDAV